MANAVQMGRAYISIGAKTGDLTAKLAAVQKQFDALGQKFAQVGKGMMATGAAIQAPLIAAAKAFASMGDTAAKAAKRAQVSVEFMSELGHVANLSGADMTSFEKSVIKMSRTLYDAGRGLSTARDAFADIGLDPQQLAGMSVEDQFLAIAQALSQVQDEATKTGAAMNIFGRGGSSLLPMLDLGAQGIQHYREEARRLGVSMSGEQASAAERLTDMLARVKAAWDGLVRTIGFQAAPAFEKTLVYLTNLVSNFRRWIDANPQIVQGLQKIATALVVGGAGFVALGKAISALSVLVSPGGVLFGLGAALLYVSGALDPLIDKWRDTVVNFEIGGKSIGSWASAVAEAWQAVTPVFESVADLIAATFEALWAELRSGFLGLLQEILNKPAEAYRRQAQAANKIADFAASPTKTGPGGVQVEKGAVERAEGLTYAARLRTRAAGLNAIAGALPTIDLLGENASSDAAAARESLSKRMAAMKDTLRSSAAALRNVVEENFSPILESVFGGKAPTEIKSFVDVFKGLGADFPEFQTPNMAGIGLGASPAIGEARKLMSSGSFSAREAQAMAGNAVFDRQLDVAQQQLKILQNIESNTEAGAVWGG